MINKIFSDGKINDVLKILPFTFLIGIFYFIIRCIVLRIKGRKRKAIWKELCYGLFICYLFSLIALVWTPVTFWDELYNLNFENTPRLMFKGEYKNNKMLYRCLFGDLRGDAHEMYMLAANVALFVPLGFFLPILFRSLRWRHVIITGFGATCVIELVQPVFGRTGDIDDIITNTSGTIVGFLCAKLIIFFCKKISSVKKSLPDRQ